MGKKYTRLTDEQRRQRAKEVKRISKRAAKPPKREMGMRRDQVLRLRISRDEYRNLRIMAAARGYTTMSEYVRALLAMDQMGTYSAGGDQG